MTVAGKRVTVTTTATKLNTTPTDSVSGSSIVVRTPVAATEIDLGGSGVTTGAGYALLANTPTPVDLQPGEDVYAITSSGTVVVHVFENGL